MSLPELSRKFVESFRKLDYSGAAELLPAIKLKYAEAGLLAPTKEFQKEDLMAARQLLEMGVLVKIHGGSSSEDISRLISQVRPFYSPELGLPHSNNETKLVALHLLLSLTENNVAEFHTELETLDDAESDNYLRYPIRLERWLMEGAYDKAWQAVTEPSQFPAPEFAILTQGLQSRIRAEIATCSEVAYTSLPIANARHLLFLSTDSEIDKFAAERGWTIHGGRVWFPGTDIAVVAPAVEEDEATEEKVNETLIGNMLGYAAEIETII